MLETVEELKMKLNEIKRIGFIKCKYTHTSKVGYTIEDLLGLERNNSRNPDYKGIEIKTRATHSKPFITLFNKKPSFPELPANYMLNHFGYPDKKNRNCKNFNVSIFGNKFHSTAKYEFTIKNRNEYIELFVRSKYSRWTDQNVRWLKDDLVETVKLKLSYLCIIKTINYKDESGYYFKIESFKIYALKSVDIFFKLIEEGYIRVTFKIGNFKKGERKGEVHDRGTGFDISS